MARDLLADAPVRFPGFGSMVPQAGTHRNPRTILDAASPDHSAVAKLRDAAADRRTRHAPAWGVPIVYVGLDHPGRTQRWRGAKAGPRAKDALHSRTTAECRL
jgi:hypothetical protein